MSSEPAAVGDDRPTPPPLRFFSTTWVDRGPVYWSLRVTFTLLTLAATLAVGFLVRFGLQGLSLGDGSRLLSLLGTVGVGVCTAITLGRTWSALERERKTRDGVVMRKSSRTRAAEAAEEEKRKAAPSQTPLLVLGCVGFFLAHFAHSFLEAPHEASTRRAYARKVAKWEAAAAEKGRKKGKRRR